MQKAENRGQSTALTSGSIKKQLVLFSVPIFRNFITTTL